MKLFHFSCSCSKGLGNWWASLVALFLLLSFFIIKRTKKKKKKKEKKKKKRGRSDLNWGSDLFLGPNLWICPQFFAQCRAVGVNDIPAPKHSKVQPQNWTRLFLFRPKSADLRVICLAWCLNLPKNKFSCSSSIETIKLLLRISPIKRRSYFYE